MKKEIVPISVRMPTSLALALESVVKKGETRNDVICTFLAESLKGQKLPAAPMNEAENFSGFTVRLDEDLLNSLTQQARLSGRSRNSEIVYRLNDKMAAYYAG